MFTVSLFLMLLVSAGLGWAAQQALRDRKVSRETVDSIRLLMGMLLTFSALVLGLLTSSAKSRFDGFNNDLSAFATDLIELDRRLRVYGPDADGIRASLRNYTAAAIADTWPAEAPPTGRYPTFGRAPGSRSIEGLDLGNMLSDVDVEIGHLEPTDEFHRQVAARLRDRVAEATMHRWQLIFSSRSTISWPFLLVLATWLSIIFGIFGLTAPRNRLVYAVVVLAAVSIASPLYLIIDYSDAQSGTLQLSSGPMRSALTHMDQVR